MKNEKSIIIKFHTIGVNDKSLMVTSNITKNQINTVRLLDCRLQFEGKEFDWQTFDDPNNPDSLFESIYRDRMYGIDKLSEPGLLNVKNNPSPFAIVTEINGKACRLEYYDNEDGELKINQDYRCKLLENERLTNYVDFPPKSTIEEELIKIFGRENINFNK